MTRLLALDTSTGPCSAALWDGRVVAYAGHEKPASQSAALLPMIDRLMREIGWSYKDLSAVVVTRGPGSFTGIRVALAAAQGIALAAKVKVASYTTLEVLGYAAHLADPGAPALPAINAGKGEWYWQFFTATAWKPAGEPSLGQPPAGFAPGTPRADTLAMLAAAHPELAGPPTPFYIRPPDAKLPQKAPL